MERTRVRGRFARESEGEHAANASAPFDGHERRRRSSKKRVPLDASRLKYCRKLVSHKVAEAMPAIVDRFANEALKGSIDHARALAKLGAFETDEGTPAKPARGGKSFAGRLLDELKKPKARREPFAL